MSKEDPVLRWIGDFGKWQAKTIGIVGWVGFFTAFHILVVSFQVPSGLDYWCVPPNFPLTLNPSTAKWTSPAKLDPDTSQPQLDDNNETIRDNCLMFSLEYSLLLVEPDTSGLNTTECTSWEYDRDRYPETVISQFDLVCGREYLRSLSQSIYMFGIMVGAIGSGILSDKYGRKLIMLISLFGILIFGLATSFSSSIAVFIFLRWCLAVFNISAYTCGFVYCMEMVGGKWSTIIGTGLQFPWALGYMTVALVAWIFPAWSQLQLAITIPIIVFIIPMAIPALVPESPRWMLFNGKAKQATALLESAAKLNERTVEKSTPVNESISLPSKDSSHPSASLLDLFRSRRLCSRTVIMYYLWFTNSFVYYGLTLNSGSLIPGDLYINFVIGGALEIVAYILTILALLFLGRRWSLSGTMVLGGVSLLLTAVVPGVTGKAVFAQIGKFLITGSFAMIYVYAAEMFPTVVRNVGVGSSSMFARVGSMLAPFIGNELGNVSKEAPIIIFGLTSLLAGLLTLLLPETKDKVLPDTIEEGERFGEDEKMMPSCCGRKQNAVYDVGHQG